MRRRQRGPLRASWSLEVEAVSRVLHHYARRSGWVPMTLQRRAMAAAVPRRAPRGVRCEPVTIGGLRGEWLIPEEVERERVLLYLHGGGYCIGSIDSHRGFIARLARYAGMRALAIDYRLAPEHPFPAALDDARAAWRYLLDRGVDPERAAIAGESAGGGLTMATLLATRDAGEPLPATAVVLSPWVDLTLRGASIDANDRYDYIPRRALERYASRYAQQTPRAHPFVSPARAELHGLPPLLIQAGEAETLLDDARLLHTRARAAGVESTLSVFPDMIHAFMVMGLPGAREAIGESADHLRAHTTAGSDM